MKVIVGMSGGVDSSISAYLLKQQGYDIEALFMKNWDDGKNDKNCSWEEDVEDALNVCEDLDIPINTIDLTEDYWDKVFQLMLNDFKAGLTPNPDVLCNQEIKFKIFMGHALELGADKIATGHYARIDADTFGNELKKGIDENKDQSYFLCRLNQIQLSRSIFPIGDMKKEHVRGVARMLNFSIHDKKDSTGICFIGERPFKEFLSQYLPSNPGLIKTINDEVVGEHDGVYFYTIGQRQGLGIGGIKGALNMPWYVVNKDLNSNTLIVAQGEDNRQLYSRGLHASNLHWVTSQPVEYPLHCHAKTRYRQPDQACVVTRIDDDKINVSFDMPQKAITPGQYVVFYDDDRCLGSGVIATATDQ